MTALGIIGLVAVGIVVGGVAMLIWINPVAFK